MIAKKTRNATLSGSKCLSSVPPCFGMRMYNVSCSVRKEQTNLHVLSVHVDELNWTELNWTECKSRIGDAITAAAYFGLGSTPDPAELPKGVHMKSKNMMRSFFWIRVSGAIAATHCSAQLFFVFRITACNSEIKLLYVYYIKYGKNFTL